MEYLDGGSLLDFVNTTKGRINEVILRKIFVQIILALEFLHNEQHVAHRDIKLENILLDQNGNIRVIDFGLSTIMNDEDSDSLTSVTGSVAYSAPEMILKKPYSKAADIWSTGVLLYTLAYSKHPFVDDRDDINGPQTIDAILNKKIELPNIISEGLRDLIQKMLVKDPKQRIKLNEIINHPWFPMRQYSLLKNYIDKQRRIDDIDFEIDEEIISQMESFGLNCEALSQLLFVQELDTVSATYKELRKMKVAKHLADFYTKFQNDFGSTSITDKYVHKSNSVILTSEQKPKLIFREMPPSSVSLMKQGRTNSSQQSPIPMQLLKSGTSNLLITPNEASDGTNTKIVPKSYVRPRISLMKIDA